MWRRNHRLSLVLGIVVLAAAATAAALLAFASGGNAAPQKTCTQLNSTQANCLFASVPGVVSSNQPGLVVVRFKNIFVNATTTHTVVQATLPAGASASSVSASTAATCSQPPFTQTVACSFGSVPGGAIVSMYVQFTIDSSAPPVDPVRGRVTFDDSKDSNTNDSFTSNSSIQIGAPIVDGAAHGSQAGTSQAGLCTSDLSQTGFTAFDLNGQQTIVPDLTAAASGGLPCTPVSGGDRPASDSENNACSKKLGSSCPASTSFVFFPVLNGNAAATVTLNYPTKPPGVTAVKNAPLFEFEPDPNHPGVLTLVQLVKCGVTPNPSPDSCLVADPTKFGTQGVSFTVSVTGSELDGSYVP
jgi:hypothetical protein